MSIRTVAALRGALSLLLLVRPSVAARALGADPRGGHHPVLRALGARHAVEALALLARPTRAVTAAAVAVDAAHVLSSVALAAGSPTHRRVAARAAALATVLPVATWLARPGRGAAAPSSARVRAGAATAAQPARSVP